MEVTFDVEFSQIDVSDVSESRDIISFVLLLLLFLVLILNVMCQKHRKIKFDSLNYLSFWPANHFECFEVSISLFSFLHDSERVFF